MFDGEDRLIIAITKSFSREDVPNLEVCRLERDIWGHGLSHEPEMTGMREALMKVLEGRGVRVLDHVSYMIGYA